MSANDPPCPNLTPHLDDLDEALFRVTGFVAALRLLSQDLQLVADTPQCSAFWAILGGVEAAVGECRNAADAVYRQSRKEALK